MQQHVRLDPENGDGRQGQSHIATCFTGAQCDEEEKEQEKKTAEQRSMVVRQKENMSLHAPPL